MDERLGGVGRLHSVGTEVGGGAPGATAHARAAARLQCCPAATAAAWLDRRCGARAGRTRADLQGRVLGWAGAGRGADRLVRDARNPEHTLPAARRYGCAGGLAAGTGPGSRAP